MVGGRGVLPAGLHGDVAVPATIRDGGEQPCAVFSLVRPQHKVDKRSTFRHCARAIH